jgi:hypothetical protein
MIVPSCPRAPVAPNIWRGFGDVVAGEIAGTTQCYDLARFEALREDRMRKAMAAVTAVVIMAAWTAAAQEPKSGGKVSDSAKIARAMSAAPPEISRKATILDVGADGQMKQLRAGTNGWVCMTESSGAPMCLDKQWQAWADALINKSDPHINDVGVAYMLKGDNGASNTDPYAEQATADNQWIVSGPHVMILTPDAALLDSLPTDPNTGGPWVMWKGTKYAHIMVPTAAMPKQPAAKAPAKPPAK